ncbi:hypothetical protein L2E82_19255 [Cichorium intybus]|uniref:Uncharacterized protein n=1 Tax=Cichorium intybus TaxID=13427 RepID=A0ACB9FBZ6_CICIN|nr:hypothetical protein L2E82_19255 [Cichorium intybus]
MSLRCNNVLYLRGVPEDEEIECYGPNDTKFKKPQLLIGYKRGSIRGHFGSMNCVHEAWVVDWSIFLIAFEEVHCWTKSPPGRVTRQVEASKSDPALIILSSKDDFGIRLIETNANPSSSSKPEEIVTEVNKKMKKRKQRKKEKIGAGDSAVSSSNLIDHYNFFLFVFYHFIVTVYLCPLHIIGKENDVHVLVYKKFSAGASLFDYSVKIK